MQRAPEPVVTPSYPVDCTTSVAAPVLDTICAGYFVLNGLVLAGAKSCDSASFGESCVESSTKTSGVLLSAGLAALCAVSASSGYGSSSKCGAVKTQNALCITGDEAACRRLNSSWTPPMKVPAGAAVLPSAPPAAAPLEPTASPAAATTGCSKDVECKGSRICERGSCVEPATRPAP